MRHMQEGAGKPIPAPSYTTLTLIPYCRSTTIHGVRGGLLRSTVLQIIMPQQQGLHLFIHLCSYQSYTFGSDDRYDDKNVHASLQKVFRKTVHTQSYDLGQWNNVRISSARDQVHM